MINSNNKLVTEKLPVIGVDAFAVFFVILSHLRVGKTAWPGIERIRKMATVMIAGELRPMPIKRTYAAIQVLTEKGMIAKTQDRLANGDWGRRKFHVTESWVSIYWNITDNPLEEPEGEDGLVEFGEAIKGEAIKGEAINDQTEPIDKEEPLLKKENPINAMTWHTEGDKRFKAAYEAVTAHLKENPDTWGSICNQAFIRLTKKEFNEELIGWLRHHQDNFQIMTSPVVRLTGGKSSLHSWLRQPMCKRKYEQQESSSRKAAPTTLKGRLKKPALPGRDYSGASPESKNIRKRK